MPVSGLADSLVTPAAAQDASVPARPTGLSAVPTHHIVTLTWDDPGDASITHYEILRRDRAIHEVGEFVTINADTGSSATTYADATVQPEQSYVYRVKAVNAHGVSESSGFSRADTPAAPAVEPTLEPTAEEFDGAEAKAADQQQEQVRSVPAEATCPGGGYNPAPTPVEVSAVPIVVASSTAQYFVLYVKHDVDGAEVELPVLVKRGEAGTTTLAENVAALPAERYRVEQYLVADPADVDGDCIDDITELGDPLGMNPVNPAATIDISEGAVAVPNRETVEALSFDSSGASYFKFLVIGIDTDRPRVYFQNTKRTRPHAHVLDVVGLTGAAGVIRGALIYDPELVAPGGNLGVYRYWMAGEYYSFGVVARIHTLLAASMPLLEDNLAYWVRSARLLQTQSDLPLYQASRIHLVFDEDVFAGTSYVALNPGQGYGLLRVMAPGERPHPRDIVIYEALPNELPRIAGIISTVPQTPLSHVNLRAIQDNSPNAFIRDALDDATVTDLLDNYVRYAVTGDGWDLRAATVQEVNAHYESSRPAQAQTPQRDLSVTTITPLSEIGFADWTAFGVKAANVAVLRKLGFPAGTVPDGFAVPFHFYDRYMRETALGQETVLGKRSAPAEEKITLGAETKLAKAVEAMLAHPVFQTDFDVQDEMLDDLRDAIKDAPTPAWMTTALTAMHANYADDQSLRYRSSTNNEDLPGFNGAGLYNSKTQHPEETEEDGISKSLKQVYASLWTFRAFSEREFHRIDHLAAAMGVLVHPNYSDERVNGVAVSVDPAYGTDGSYYVNSQIGEDLVTNPEALSVPEEILLNSSGTHTVVAISNQVPPGQLLLSDAQLTQLGEHLEVIHDEFAKLYNAAPGAPFAMEIEFKITSDDVLAIKQARPWIFSASPLTIEITATIPADALTASFDDPPATHDGNPFTVRFRFSENVLTSFADLRDHAVAVMGGAVTGARRLDGRSDWWEIRVTPDSNADVRLVLPANRPCTVPGAVCTYNGGRLSAPLQHTVAGPGIIVSSPPTGGGGGGPPPVPIPSDKDFDWNVTRDIESLDRGNDLPTGIWSDGQTLWVLENAASGADSVFAYDLEAGERQQNREFELDRRNRFSHGIWSDGETIWIADSGQDRLFAYVLESGARVEEREFELAERNRDPRGIWSDTEVMYVLDSVKDALFVYDLGSGELLAEHALDKLNESPRGIWSDGVTTWVSDDGAKRLFAYEFDDEALKRNEDLEFTFRSLLKAGNGNPRGIWSDGDIMYVVDEQDDKVYTYNIPDAIIALLSSLTLSGIELTEFSPGRLTYSTLADTSATVTTVEAIATQEAATVVIAPTDADADAENGHQIALDAVTEITITVTSINGSRTKSYRVVVEKPPCLTGLTSERLSEVTFVGGSLDDLGRCAREHGVSAFFYWTGESWLLYAPDAPEFLSRPFRSNFAAGIPAGASLIAATTQGRSTDN